MKAAEDPAIGELAPSERLGEGQPIAVNRRKTSRANPCLPATKIGLYFQQLAA